MIHLRPRYCCHLCGALFDEPSLVTRRENLDGEHGWRTYTEALCPVCGDADNFEELPDPEEDEI